MIAKLTGIVDTLKPTEMILNVQGVGYHLALPFSTYEAVKDNKEVSLFVYTLHKEDQLKLFGFYREEEKELFLLLIAIAGIGPSIALSILSGISASRLRDAVATDNPSLLMKIPGIGKSKAEKLIFELKRKLKKLEGLSQGVTPVETGYHDAIDALISLGFEESKSVSIVNEIVKQKPELPVEGIIKEALKQISG